MNLTSFAPYNRNLSITFILKIVKLNFDCLNVSYHSRFYTLVSLIQNLKCFFLAFFFK